MPEQLTENAQGMTADELIARLFAEQGYLVIASSTTLMRGEIIQHAKGVLGSTITPLRIVTASNVDEYLAQSRRGHGLVRGPNWPPDPAEIYYYRVEAAD